MDCTCFRKYVVALAEGEPEVRQHFEALEHLDGCPSCARRVADITALKVALARVYADARAPRHLRERVLSSLGSEALSARYDPQPPHAGVAASLPYRLIIPVSIAAALLLAVLLYQYRPHSEPYPGTITVVTGRAVADAREQHRWCIANRGPDHHDASLTRDLDEIARRLSSELQLTVLVPDLLVRGFALVGADRCGILGQRGAHVLYRSKPAGGALSVFTVGRMATLGSGDGGASLPPEYNREYFVSAAEAEESLSVVAWHDRRQSYVVCGKLPAAALLDLVEQVRLAGTGRPGAPWPTSPTLAFAAGKKFP